MIVDLPQPDGPTNATFLPAAIYRLKFSKTFFSLDSYLNVILFTEIFPYIGVVSFFLPNLSSL